ncbi:MAG: hypothetical protein PHY31_06140, partial [Smithellaceae bacterium]|nr:hypothetical protein [Smithellaceae bacterium]
GGEILHLSLAVLCFFFFMWQVPHFFTHARVYGPQYAQAGLPSLTAVFGPTQLDRLTFHWLFATAVSLQLLITGDLISSPIVKVALIACSLWIVVIGSEPLRRPGLAFGVFRKTNFFMLIVMLLICVDQLPMMPHDQSTSTSQIVSRASTLPFKAVPVDMPYTEIDSRTQT